MKKLSILFLSIALMAGFTSCKKVVGEGPAVTETRGTGNFTSVASSISANVYYKQDPVYKVEITAQQNILNVIETNIVGNELLIKFRNGVRVKSHENIVVNVSSPMINGLRLSGSGNLIASDSISSGSMSLTLSGSGNINLHSLVATSLDANISGSGNITISNGSLNTGSFRISGSGNIDAMNVPASSITTTTSGSGEMRVNASQNLDVTISGSGSVYYKGTPGVNTHISGSGKVMHQ
ncbi:MAG: head GIN domain-containing protein [Bacteroidota bacterium]|nr:head GIN domain-containing protein [Bacteroidota bacterium]